MAKRKSDTQLADQDAGTAISKDAKSTLIEDLNALSHDTFQTRFFNDTTSTEHKHNGTIWKTQLYFAQSLPSEILQQCFQLIETTSRHDYEPSSFGWHPQRKKREMKEPEMRYLLLNEVAPEPRFSGFASFMFTHDSTPAMPVLYIYEIHLTESVRGKGLGGFLMRLIETIAREAGVEKVMLTCFLSNSNALAFYRKWGFEVDVCSPGDRRTRKKVVKADYVIMSKDLSGLGEGPSTGKVVEEVTHAGLEAGKVMGSANAEQEGDQMNDAQSSSRRSATSTGPPTLYDLFPAPEVQRILERAEATRQRLESRATFSPQTPLIEHTVLTELDTEKANVKALESKFRNSEEGHHLLLIDFREEEKLVKKLEAKLRKSEDARRNIVKSAETMKAGYEANLEDGMRVINKTAKSLLTTTEEMIALRKELAQAEEELEEVEAERDGLVNERDGLEVERDDLQGERDDFEAERDDLEAERDGLQEQLEGKEEERAAMQADRDHWRDFAHVRGRKMADMREELEGLREDLEEERSMGGTVTQNFYFR